MNNISIIEKILASSENYTESDLRDPHVQIFILLVKNPHKGFTIDEVIKEVNNMGLVKLDDRKKSISLFNILYANDLAVHEFNTNTYKYKPSAKSKILYNNIQMIQAM